MNDVELTFGWANDPEARAMSFNTAPIPFEDHSKWFERRVSNQGHGQELLIAFLDGEAVGQIRFDLEKDMAEISYMIDRSYRGRGLGKRIIQDGMKACSLKPVGFLAQVKKENLASCKIFEACGFKKIEDDSIVKYIKAENR